MTAFGNKCYKVKEAFRILKINGSSPSNTYIGSSRAHKAVLMSCNAEPGDEIHDLVGGLFHVSAKTGETSCIRMVPPKSALEKSYGFNPEKSRLEMLEKAEVISRFEAPQLSGDYKDARERSRKQYPEHQGGIYLVDRDPLNDVADEFIGNLQGAGIDVDVSSFSFASQTAYDSAKFTFTIGGTDDVWRAFIQEDGLIRLITPPDLENGSPNFADGNFRSSSMQQIELTMVSFIEQKTPTAPTP